jgi:hypothetical protein
MAKRINAAHPATTIGKASHIGEPFAVTDFLTSETGVNQQFRPGRTKPSTIT